MDEMINVFWFRRDLRLNDNRGLYEALKSGRRVLPVFIFDTEILSKLQPDDKRVLFIHNRVEALNTRLSAFNTSLLVYHGSPVDVFRQIISEHEVETVFTNRDYEPAAIQRDLAVAGLLSAHGTGFISFKDQVLFEAGDILKPDGNPYVVFTPYSRKWLEQLNQDGLKSFDTESVSSGFVKSPSNPIPSLAQMGFDAGNQNFPEMSIPVELIANYATTRNYPGLDRTTRLGMHLRFGTISVRDCIRAGQQFSAAWLNELIWREFFMQIMAFYPGVVNHAFKPVYDRIQWSDNEHHFRSWCEGKTGYPLVDAGMRELSQTGFMHNRVRMVAASFLTKHLLIDWRWGEAWFAEKLLDFELSSNNGNWQWAAGSGCDAAPYFRIFNPSEQLKKFDPDSIYVKRWVPEYETIDYPEPIVVHAEARKRCFQVYTDALKPGKHE